MRTSLERHDIVNGGRDADIDKTARRAYGKGRNDTRPGRVRFFAAPLHAWTFA